MRNSIQFIFYYHDYFSSKWTLKKSKRATENEQSRDTGNQEWTIQRYRQRRMNNPEKQATKNEQSRDTGNQEWTIQRYRQRRMNNPEIQATKNEQSRATGNAEWTIQRYRQYWAQNTEKTHIKLKRWATRTPQKPSVEPMSSRKISSSSFI